MKKCDKQHDAGFDAGICLICNLHKYAKRNSYGEPLCRLSEFKDKRTDAFHEDIKKRYMNGVKQGKWSLTQSNAAFHKG